MRISAPDIENVQGEVVYSTDLLLESGNAVPLIFRVPEEFGYMVSDRSDAALLTCLIPAMTRGEDIRVYGTVTDELLFKIQTDYMALLKLKMPRLHEITVEVEQTVPVSESRGSGVATGFSAGIDSWQVLSQCFYDEAIPPSMRVSHLLYNNVGSHGRGGDTLFRRRLSRIRQVVQETGLPVVSVDSNAELLYRGYAFSATHTPRNAAVPLLLQDGLRHFFYASAYEYQEVAIRADRVMAKADPVALPLLSSTGLVMHSIGSALSRVEKTLAIVDNPATYTTLDVCISPGSSDINCTKCWKCRRTALTLEIAGVLKRYSAVFDLDLWERTRESAWRYAVRKTDSPLEQEVVAFAEKRGYALTTSSAQD